MVFVCGWPERLGVDPPLSSSPACLHMAFIAFSLKFVFLWLGQFDPGYKGSVRGRHVLVGGGRGIPKL